MTREREREKWTSYTNTRGITCVQKYVQCIQISGMAHEQHENTLNTLYRADSPAAPITRWQDYSNHKLEEKSQ